LPQSAVHAHPFTVQEHDEGMHWLGPVGHCIAGFTPGQAMPVPASALPAPPSGVFGPSLHWQVGQPLASIFTPYLHIRSHPKAGQTGVGAGVVPSTPPAQP
jgi:hypothetical protein